MNHEDIIKLAREAGLGTSLCHNSVEGDRVWIEGADWHDELERFVALVEERAAATEREECAKVCEARVVGDHNREDAEAKRCAAAIRARSKE